MSYKHIPVLLKEVVEFLDIKKNHKYIDATAGGGGYTEEILRKGGIVLGIDIDEVAISNLKNKFSGEKNVVLVNDNFANIDVIAERNNFANVAGIVFDLGLSSYQIEESGRGFSFLRDEPLDMRMGRSIDITAADIVNTWTKEELYELFSKMGEERFALTIADNIIKSRRVKPIKNSQELVKIAIESVKEKRKIHPATKVFQALRIAVNDEINNLFSAIQKGFTLLEINGRMVIVSFHSLEDRLVKIYFRNLEMSGRGRMITDKPLMSSGEEKDKNKRSRSAKLRVIERIT